jgi:hypothetical protein
VMLRPKGRRPLKLAHIRERVNKSRPACEAASQDLTAFAPARARRMFTF